MTQHDWRLAIPVTVSWLTLVFLEKVAPHNDVIVWILLIAVAIFGGLGILTRLHTSLLALVLFILLLRFLITAEPEPWGGEYVGIFPWVQDLHAVLLKESKNLPGLGAQLIPGLTVGDDSLVSDALDKAMKTTSLTHLTAISGANCSILITVVVVVLGALGVSRFVKTLVGFVALVTYVVIVGPQPSVLRASLMAVVVLIALGAGRPTIGLPLLATVVYLLLLWDPWLAVDFGFALSASATAALIVLTEPLMQKLSRVMPMPIAALLAIPIAAQVACQPITFILSPSVQTYGVLANVLASPAAPISTVLGLVLCVSILCAPALASSAVWLQWLPATWIASCASSLSQFPGAQIELPTGVFGFALTLALSICLIVAVTTMSQKKSILMFALSLSCLVVMFISAVFTQLIERSNIPKDWDIAACDVGQGDALVVKSGDSYALIDTGRYPERITKCLNKLGVEQIELLVLTHFDLDHVGGVVNVETITGQALIGPSVDEESDRLIRDLVFAGIEVNKAHRGDEGRLGEFTWRVVWPDPGREDMQTGNQGSVTIELSFNQFTALFTGDLDKEAENALLNSGELMNVDVVKVSHHGSADQSKEFYAAIDPEIAIFSVGKENRYGHPRQETLEIMQSLGAMTPRTDEDGLILISHKGNTLSVWTEH